MANSDKNIVIIPNRNQPGQPNVVFTGNANVPVTLRVADDNSLSFENVTGQLFRIYNNVTSGSIFSVNDISGIPVINVDASGNISLSAFGGNVGIGTASPVAPLHIFGNIRIGNTSTISGVVFPDGTFQNTAASPGAFSASNVTVTDTTTNATFYPSFVEATNGNIGIRADSMWTFNPNTNQLSLTGNAWIQNSGRFGNASITNTTAATSTTTGALTVAGGVGIAGNAWIANATIASNGSLIIQRSSTQYLQISEFDSDTAPIIRSYSAASNAKQISFDSRTDSAGTAVTAGNLGHLFQTNGSTVLQLSQSGNVATAYNDILAAARIIGGLGVSSSIYANGGFNGFNVNIISNTSTVPINGMWSPAANYLAFSTNGSERARIDSNGNLAIGTTSTSYPLYFVRNNNQLSGGAYGVVLTGTTTPASTSSAYTTGLNSSVYTGATSADITGGIKAVEFGATNNATANTLSNSYGAYIGAYNNSTGNVTNQTALYGRVDNALGGGTVQTAYALLAGVTGAGNITTGYGLYSSVSASNVTTGYGLYTSTITATTKYSIYTSDATAPTYMAGNLYIGGTVYSPIAKIGIQGSSTGGVSTYGIMTAPTIQSDVTSTYFGYRSSPSTLAASFTLPSLYHFYASNSTIGAGSAITNQFGFITASTLNGATNNYGYYGLVPESGTNNWNIYMSSTAPNYMAGSLGLGTTSLTGTRFRSYYAVTNPSATQVNSQIDGLLTLSTGNNANAYYSVYSAPVIDQGANNATVSLGSGGSLRGFYSLVRSSGVSGTVTATGGYLADVRNIGAGTLTNGYGFQSFGATNSGGGTFTNYYGFYMASSTGATNNYGYYSNIGSAVGAWNFYAAGTAPNYLAGNLVIANTSTSTSTTSGALTVAGGIGVVGNIYVGGTIFGSVNTAINASNLVVTNTTTNATFYPAFVEATSGNIGIRADGDLTYNPSTNQLSLSGNIFAQNSGQFGNLSITNTTTSTSSTTGALTVAGGVGVNGALFVNGLLSGGLINGTGITSSGTISAAGQITGDSLYSNTSITGATVNSFTINTTDLNISGTSSLTGTSANTVTTSATTGALKVAGGIATQSNLWVSASAWMNNLSIISSNLSASTTTGALTVAGGVGIAGNIYAGGNIIARSLNATAVGNITPSTGQFTSAIVQNGLTSGTITSNGFINGASLYSSGTISAVGTITAASLNANTSVYSPYINATTSANVNGITSNTSVIVNGTVDSTGTTTGAVIVAGGVGIAKTLYVGNAAFVQGNLTVGGNLVVNGNVTYINTNVTVLEDPVVTVGTGPNGANLTVADTYDRGVEFHYYSGSADRYGFLGWQNTTGRLTYIANAVGSLTTQVYSGPLGDAQFGNVIIGGASNTPIPATSTSTGAITIGGSGGIGVGGNIYVGGTIFGAVNTAINSSNIVVTNTSTDATFYPAFVEATSGNIGIRADSNLSFNPNTNQLSLTGNAWVQNSGRFGNASITNTTAATSTTTGALTVAGGTGITGNVFAGSNLLVAGSVGIGTTLAASTLYVAGKQIISNVLTSNTMVYTGKSLNINAQETAPYNTFFSPDGYTLYVAGRTGDDITVYRLTTPWDISTATHVGQSPSLATQNTDLAGLYFDPTGKKVWTTGFILTNNIVGVYEYDLAIPWNVFTGSLSYSQSNLSVYNINPTPVQVAWKSDGTSLYLLGYAIGGTHPRSVVEFKAATPWTVAGMSNTVVSSFSVVNQEVFPLGMSFTTDGSTMLITGNSGDDITVYDLATPWSITTARYRTEFSLINQISNITTPSGSYLKPDGSTIYITNATAGNVIIYQFDLGNNSRFDLVGNSTMSGDVLMLQNTTVAGQLTGWRANFSGNVGIGTTTPTQILDVAGSALFRSNVSVSNTTAATSTTTGALTVAGGIGIAGNIFTPSSVWAGNMSISNTTAATSTTTGALTVAGGAGISGNVFAGSNMLVARQVGIGTTLAASTLYVAGKQIISNVFTSNTMVYTGKSLDISAQEAGPGGPFISPDGVYLYIIGTGGNDVTVYQMSTPWDISTATHIGQSASVAAQNANPYTVYFDTTGKKMWITGFALTNNIVGIYEYDLSIPWNIFPNSLSYTQSNLNVYSSNLVPRQIYWKPDGTALFLVGSSTGTYTDSVMEFKPVTPWTIAGMSNTVVNSFSVASQESNPLGLNFTNDGSTMLIIGSTGDDVTVYDLAEPWTITTARHRTQFSLTNLVSNITVPAGSYLKPDGSALYITNDVGTGTGNVVIYQFDLGNNSRFDLVGNSTMSGDVLMLQNTTVAGQLTGWRANFNGNVGIGTTTPTQILDVAGSALFRSNVSVSNTTNATSSTTGALTVAGGVGIAGNAWIANAKIASNGTLIVQRTATQYLQISEFDSDTAPYFRSYSDTTNAKPINFDSRTNTAGTAKTAGNLGYVFYTNGTGVVYFNESGNAAVSSNDTLAAVRIVGGLALSNSIYANGGFNGYNVNVTSSTATVPINGMWSPSTNTLAFSTNGTERARIDSAGGFGIGTTFLTGYRLRIGGSVTGNTSGYNIYTAPTIQSDVINYYGIYHIPSIAASTAIGTFMHYRASQGTYDPTATITSQYGFYVDTLSSGTNNYGFYGGIPSSVGNTNYNLYMSGNAPNYLAGGLGIGVGASSIVNNKLRAYLAPTDITATTSIGQFDGTHTLTADSGNVFNATSSFAYIDQGTANATVTLSSGGSIHGFNADVRALGTTGTVTAIGGYYAVVRNTNTGILTNGYGYHALGAVNSGGGTFTNYYGFYAGASTAATNNYGFYSATAAAANAWNFYAAGTAANYMAGSLSIGTTSTTLGLLATSSTFTDLAAVGSNQYNSSTHLLTANNSSTIRNFFTTNINQGAFNQTTGISSGGAIQGVSSQAYANGASGTVTGLSAFWADVRNTGAGTLSTAVGFNSAAAINSGGGTLTNHYHFLANAGAVATNEYGFYSNIASGVGQWNLYANGTANNYFAGNAWIGTTSGDAKVTISRGSGSGGAPNVITASNSYVHFGKGEWGGNNDGVYMLAFGYTSGVNAPAYMGYREESTAGQTYGNLGFFTRNVTTDTAPTERLRITSGGLVGIGTTTPSQLLDVAGNAVIRNSGWIGNLSITNATASTSTTSGALTVAGGVGIAGNVYVGGTIFGAVNTAINASNIVITNTSTNATFYPSFVEATSGNIGIRANSNLSFNPNTNQLSLTGNAWVQNSGRFGNVSITNTTASTSTTTGVLVVAGGVGVAGNIYAGGTIFGIANTAINASNLVVTNTTTNATFYPVFVEATSGNIGIRADSVFTFNPNTNQLSLTGNILAQNSNQFGNVSITNTTASTSTATGALTVAGGAGISGNVFAGSNMLVAGQVGIGTTTPTSDFKLDTNGNLRVNGNIVATSEITAYFSDVRLKSNVTPITNAVNLVMAINGVYYNPNDIAVRLAGENQQSHKVGLLAQEVEKVLPQIIRHAPFDIGDNGISKSGEYYKTIQYERIVPLLVEAIKEQTSMIQDQDKRINVLEEKLKDLSNLINTSGRL